MYGAADGARSGLSPATHVKMEIFIPETHLQELRKALQAVGAGRMGAYDSCLAYSRVTGAWRPLEGASPYRGTIGEIEEAPELKVEVCVEADRVEETVKAIKAAHPYEAPAIYVLPLLFPVE